jgi:hypothetical protein
VSWIDQLKIVPQTGDERELFEAVSMLSGAQLSTQHLFLKKMLQCLVLLPYI